MIKEPQAIALYKDYIEDLTNFRYNALENSLERSFYRKVRKILKQMEKQNLEFKTDGLREKIQAVELYKIQNIFGAGLETNRRKNDGFEHYKILDQMVMNNAVPCRFYIKKRLEAKQIAKIFMQLNLSFMSNIKIQIQEKETGTPLLQDPLYQIENNTEKGQLYKDQIVQGTIHTMTLEAQIIECDYKQLNSLMATGQSFSQSNIGSYKNYINDIQFKIIDFDNFMNGNQIARERHDPAL